MNRNAEGCPVIKMAAYIGIHDLSPLQDKILIGISEAVQSMELAGNVL